jgi:formylglycine-generating enzyme required for sulfatase activity
LNTLAHRTCKPLARGGAYFTVALVLVTSGCNALFGLAPSSLASDGGASDTSTTPSVDAGHDSPGEAITPGCAGWAGPAPINIDGIFCIDSTQVTYVQYAAFVAAVSPTTFPQEQRCIWNTSFVPDGGLPRAGTLDDYPVTSVDFCDAAAYCAWAGKRLCAEFTGLSTAYDAPTDGEMYHACSGGTAALAYAYGPAYNPDACATATGQIAPVKSLSNCVSTVYLGLYDMNGNVGAWENMCSETMCRHNAPIVNADYRCAVDNGDLMTLTASVIGIRCCSDPTGHQ